MRVQYADKGIYCSDNPYGFIYNVNHPLINHLYSQYKKNHSLPGQYPVSDAERHRFEFVIGKMIKAGAIVVKNR